MPKVNIQLLAGILAAVLVFGWMAMYRHEGARVPETPTVVGDQPETEGSDAAVTGDNPQALSRTKEQITPAESVARLSSQVRQLSALPSTRAEVVARAERHIASVDARLAEHGVKQTAPAPKLPARVERRITDLQEQLDALKRH